jgi:hypothetical protein
MVATRIGAAIELAELKCCFRTAILHEGITLTPAADVRATFFAMNSRKAGADVSTCI